MFMYFKPVRRMKGQTQEREKDREAEKERMELLQ